MRLTPLLVGLITFSISQTTHATTQLPLLDLKAFAKEGMEKLAEKHGGHNLALPTLVFQDGYEILDDGRYKDLASIALIVPIHPYTGSVAYVYHLRGLTGTYMTTHLDRNPDESFNFYDQKKPIYDRQKSHFADPIYLDTDRDGYLGLPTKIIAPDEFRTLTKNMELVQPLNMSFPRENVVRTEFIRSQTLIPSSLARKTLQALNNQTIDLARFQKAGIEKLTQEYGAENVGNIHGIYFADGVALLDKPDAVDLASITLLVESPKLPEHTFLAYSHRLHGKTGIHIVKQIQFPHGTNLEFYRPKSVSAQFVNISQKKERVYVDGLYALHPDVSIEYRGNSLLNILANDGGNFLDILKTLSENNTLELIPPDMTPLEPWTMSGARNISAPIFNGMPKELTYIISPNELRTITSLPERKSFTNESKIPESLQPNCEVFLKRG